MTVYVGFVSDLVNPAHTIQKLLLAIIKINTYTKLSSSIQKNPLLTMNGLLVKHVSESHFDTNVQITQWKNDPYALCFVFFGILENVTQNIF